MGQYWNLHNLDKRQSWLGIGKFYGCLFTGSPQSLVKWLYVPALPRHVEENPYFSLPNTRGRGCWAGDRIICVGDYNACDDYPTGLLTDKELQEIKDIPYDEDECMEGLNRLSEIAYAESPRHSYFDLEVDDDNLFVLRNLSKGEYVRSDKIPRTRDIQLPGFGEIVMSRILWSTIEPTRHDISRGIWAGDRFDIRTIDSVEGGEWKDVSDEVVKEISDIWERKDTKR